jgi:hypothetical protein
LPDRRRVDGQRGGVLAPFIVACVRRRFWLTPAWRRVAIKAGDHGWRSRFAGWRARRIDRSLVIAGLDTSTRAAVKCSHRRRLLNGFLLVLTALSRNDGKPCRRPWPGHGLRLVDGQGCDSS